MNIQEIKINQINNFLIQENIPLHDKNWFATGGMARYFAQPINAEEFQKALSFATQNNLPVFVLGHGANILISDTGFNGLVIQPNIHYITIHEDQTGVYVQTGSGLSMHDLIFQCLENQLIGLEEFSGIPGTVGGSVYINLHYFEFLLEQFLYKATILNRATLALEVVTKDWFEFGYNTSKLQDESYYLVDATFKVKKATTLEASFAKGRAQEIIRHRQKRYPSKNTCGSFFRNFQEHEVTLMSNNKKMIYVAYYLDKIGAKGQLHYGDAIVSYQHANMIVNRGNATSSHIITLARMMQESVKKEFNIIPQPECRLIGFEEYPLL